MGFALSKAQTEAPTKFILNQDGLTDFVIIETPSKSKHELFSQSLEWLRHRSSNNRSLILDIEENSYIRFEERTNNLYIIEEENTQIPLLAKYKIEIHFREGKYIFDVTDASYLDSENTWYEIPFYTFYKQDGSLKRQFKYKDQIPNFFNDLNLSLKTYLTKTENNRSP